ncbi:MAG: hypothetical protein U1A78_41570 [Polyangia bacterium]
MRRWTLRILGEICGVRRYTAPSRTGWRWVVVERCGDFLHARRFVTFWEAVCWRLYLQRHGRAASRELASQACRCALLWSPLAMDAPGGGRRDAD